MKTNQTQNKHAVRMYGNCKCQ